MWSQRLLHVPIGLTFNNSSFWSHSTLTCSIWFSEKWLFPNAGLNAFYDRGRVRLQGDTKLIFRCIIFLLLWRCDPTRVMASSFLTFLDHTQRRTTVGRAPMDEWLARRRDLYLTTHNTHNTQTSMSPVGFEPTISARERPQTYALDSAATGTGIFRYNSG